MLLYGSSPPSPNRWRLPLLLLLLLRRPPPPHPPTQSSSSPLPLCLLWPLDCCVLLLLLAVVAVNCLSFLSSILLKIDSTAGLKGWLLLFRRQQRSLSSPSALWIMSIGQLLTAVGRAGVRRGRRGGLPSRVKGKARNFCERTRNLSASHRPTRHGYDRREEWLVS